MKISKSEFFATDYLREHFMKKYLFIVLTSLVATSAYADRWALVHCSDISANFISLDSMTVDGNIRDVWEAQINIDPKEKHDLIMLNEQIDCKKRVLKGIYVVVYRKGNRIDSSEMPENRQRLIPGTKGDILYNTVCKPVDEKWIFEADEGVKEFTEFIQKVLRDNQQKSK